MSARLVRAVTVHADGRVTDRAEADQLETWQRLVGGHVEYLPLGPGGFAYANESGLLDGLPHNALAVRVVEALRPEMGFTLATYGLRGDIVFLGLRTDGETDDCPSAIAALVHHLAAVPR